MKNINVNITNDNTKLKIDTSDKVVLTKGEGNVHRLVFNRCEEFNNAELIVIFKDNYNTFKEVNLEDGNEYVITDMITEGKFLKLQIYFKSNGESLEYASSNVLTFKITDSVNEDNNNLGPVNRRIEELSDNGFTDAHFNGNELTFKNYYDDIVKVIELNASYAEGCMNGWTPIIAIEEDNNFQFLKVVDWVGGNDIKPSTDVYIGINGFTEDINGAVNVKGSNGSNVIPIIASSDENAIALSLQNPNNIYYTVGE